MFNSISSDFRQLVIRYFFRVQCNSCKNKDRHQGVNMHHLEPSIDIHFTYIKENRIKARQIYYYEIRTISSDKDNAPIAGKLAGRVSPSGGKYSTCPFYNQTHSHSIKQERLKDFREKSQNKELVSSLVDKRLEAGSRQARGAPAIGARSLTDNFKTGGNFA